MAHFEFAYSTIKIIDAKTNMKTSVLDVYDYSDIAGLLQLLNDKVEEVKSDNCTSMPAEITVTQTNDEIANIKEIIFAVEIYNNDLLYKIIQLEIGIIENMLV